MASFGQGFIQSLTQPSYGEGLFKLGGLIGSAPARSREEERRKQMTEQFVGASPVQQGRMLQQEGTRTGNLALAMQGQTVEKEALKQGAMQGIQALVTQVSDPSTDETLIKQSRQTALQLARDNNIPESQIRELLDAAQKQRLTGDYDTEIQRIKNLSLVAKQLIGTEKGKEKFVQQAGEKYGYVFDEVSRQTEEQRARLQVAKDNAKKTKFAYTEEDLKELGLNAKAISAIKSLQSGSQKNAAVLNAVKALGADTPTAALLRFYADSLVDSIMTENGWSYGSEKRLAEAKAIANSRAREFFDMDATGATLANSVVDAQSKSEQLGDLNMSGADLDALIVDLLREVKGSN